MSGYTRTVTSDGEPSGPDLPPAIERLFEEALAKRSAAEVWAHLGPARALLNDRAVALSWMTLAQASPRERSLGDDARAVLEAHRSDAEVVAVTLTALVRRIDASGLDAPIDVAGPIREGIDAARAILAAGGPSGTRRAALSAALGNAALRVTPQVDEGIEALTAAIAIDPEGPWLVDLLRGLKRARRFRAALPLARNAVSKLGARPALLTELAIVALGAGEPDEARGALRSLGLQIEGDDPGALPLVPDLTPVAVRVPSRAPPHQTLAVAEGDGFETVWAQPLSPMHGVVRTATFREAACDFGDVILFDVAPLAMIARPDAPTERAPLLPFLQVLKPGDEQRFRFLSLEQQPGQTEAILTTLPPEVVVQVHSASVRKVCPRCMAGETLVKHEHMPPEEQRFVIGKLVVPSQVAPRDVAAALDRAPKGGVLLAVPALYEALGRTPEAGKHHQRWGAIERGLGAAR